MHCHLSPVAGGCPCCCSAWRCTGTLACVFSPLARPSPVRKMPPSCSMGTVHVHCPGHQPGCHHAPSPVDEAAQLPHRALQRPGGLVELEAVTALGSILQEGQAVLRWRRKKRRAAAAAAAAAAEPGVWMSGMNRTQKGERLLAAWLASSCPGVPLQASAARPP
jgi:hypothetical protein